ncbi:hypothetical protein Thiowin_04555 [Thiorhodovibrio winogradskyi]|uniref:Uncharacterized protein n=1 Tax=Thiorhodovibrio winogradskyi TaxID=77007 RepID=A0ABZ0SFY0_9GAMM|nr:hypothetical protein [Thiorhodovibrio winogradskyi]
MGAATAELGLVPPHPTLFLRRSLYARFGVFDTGYRIAADYDLMLSMLTQLDVQGNRPRVRPGDGAVRYLQRVLVRLGGLSKRSLRTVASKSWEDYRALRANGVGGLGALAWKNLTKLPQFVTR